MSKNRQIKFLGAVFCLALAGVFLSRIDRVKKPKQAVIDFEKNNEAIQDELEQKIGVTREKLIMTEEKKLPEQILLGVPFTSQAPWGKWDEYHEEACEEASLLMVAYFAQGKKLTPAVAEKEIQSLMAYEIKNGGNYKDATVAEIGRLGAQYYHLKNWRAVYDFEPENLKKYLAEGKPLIIPVAGRLLKNPNFKSPGPLYHNLVAIGYEGDMIITNDPGTRKGKGYRYNLKTLYEAIHDFPGDKLKIETGRKALLVWESF